MLIYVDADEFIFIENPYDLEDVVRWSNGDFAETEDITI
jgi:hypothetical protein